MTRTVSPSRRRSLRNRVRSRSALVLSAVVSVLSAWAMAGCRREAASPPPSPATVAGTAGASGSAGAAASLPPETSSASDEAASEPAFIVLSDTTLPRKTAMNPVVRQDFYDSLAMSLDSTEDATAEDYIPLSEVTDTGAGQFLAAGTFHGNEVPEDADQHEWLGAIFGPGACRIQPVRILVRLVHDEIADEEGKATGKAVTAMVEGKVGFLARNITALETRPCEVLDSTDMELRPGRRVAFRYRGAEYVLAVTEHRSPWFLPESGGPLDICRLILTRKTPGGDLSAGILRQFNSNGIRLLRLGDFDGDGFPDLLLDDAGHYNKQATSLYLSRPAAPGQMLKRVGSFVSIGC